MDKYEFNIKVEQIKKMVNKEDFATAMKIADTIDWRRVRNANLLSTISQVYEKNKEYQEAKEVLLLAFERAPIGKRFLYKLTELALNEGSVREAEDYYREFCELAPDDTRQYILRYLILKGKNASIDQLIQALERYINTELDEKWMYELAELYARAGRGDDCVQLCDKMILMFGIGTYVEKATELKKRYAPPSSQQRKPAQIQNYGSNSGTIIQMPGNSGYNGNWQNPGSNYGAGTDGYNTDNNYGTGYGSENSYGAGADYGSGAGYGTEQGYGPVGGYGFQDGYGAETGYSSQNNYEAGAQYGSQNNYGAGYEAENGYGTGAGYGPGSNYTAEQGYGVENGYGAGPGYGFENNYQVNSNYDTGNGYRAGTDYNAGNSYGAEPGYNTASGYGTGQGYDSENGYGAESGFNTGSGYGTEPGYDAGNSYGTEPGYNVGDGYGTDSGYDGRDGYGTDPGYDARNGYGAGSSYGTENNYGTEPDYGPENSYEAPPSSDNGYGANTAYNMNSQGYPPYNGMNSYGNTGNYDIQGPYEDNPVYHTGNVYAANESDNTGGGYSNNQAYGAEPNFGGDGANRVSDRYTGNAYAPTEHYGEDGGNYSADAVYGNDMVYGGRYGTQAGYGGGGDYRDSMAYENGNGYGGDETYEAGSPYGAGAEEEIPPQRPAGYGAREHGYTHPHGGYPPVGPYVVDEEMMANLHQAAAEKELAAEMSRISTEEYVEPDPVSNQTRVFRGKNNIRILRPRMEEEEKPIYHRSYTPHHMIIEAKTAQEGVKTAVEELKRVHQETGVNNSVIKITGSKLSRRGIINVSDKLAGKDLIVEEAGDLTQKDLEELQMLLERDETGMIVVLIDNPLQIEDLHQQNPGFINLFKCISSEKDAEEPIQAVEQKEERKQEEPPYQEEPESSEPQPEPESETEQVSQPEQASEPDADSEPESNLDVQPELKADSETESEPKLQEGQEEPEETAKDEESESTEQETDVSDEETDDEDENPEESFQPDKEPESYDSEEYGEEGYSEQGYSEERYSEEEYQEDVYQDDEPEEESYDEDYDDIYGEEEEYNDEEYGDPEPVDEDEELGIDAFTDYAVQYASEIDCSITGKSLLALCQHVEAMEENGIPLTRANAEDMIEEAADKAEKPSIGGLIKGVFSSKYDKEGLLILKEEHFL